ncbi:putative repeat protein (TIGR01451 family) [Variovorax sp. 54]|uniref:DUF11 domain-containing protein n=1 Tax=Variovorax sp. 54 TaxID=2035212 RepID=UPI000C180F70|nr:DUF11 domain-containing protein [Variovorax sp. 54]PIF73226.1 putative repeat protein (TIGR01451 family) [Variovorax sp. 54]
MAAARIAFAAFGLVLAAAFAQAAPAPGGIVIRSIATGTYVPAGQGHSETASSNVVIASVLPVEALSLTQDQRVNRPPGTVATLSHLLTNTGNVASNYVLSFVNNGAGCLADGLDLSALRVARDSNHNGVVDADDLVLIPGAAGTLALQPGQTAELLVQGTVPAAASGSACLLLTATTALQGASASNRDIVEVGCVAVLALVKSASYAGVVVPGSTRIDFSISGTNTGARDAQPGGTAAPTGTPVLVNGSPRNLLLLRDVVPAGTRYIAGSLQGTAAGAVRLFRMPGDPDFSYRTAEDGAAVEVAIGVPTALSRNASIAMQFAVQAKADLTGDIRNTAHSQYNDGVAAAASPSNTVVIAASPTQGQSRIGVAKAASTPRMNRGADGQPDGTATVTFDVNVRNYGTASLYGVQAVDVLEGPGAAQFGTRTTAAAPGPHQYMVVPGTLTIVGSQGGGASGTVAAVSGAFDGTASAQNLLAPGAMLPAGGQFTVRFDVRFNLAGRTGTLLNTVRAQAALAAGGPPAVFDDSVNGSNPDADGDGNPTNDTSPTPVSTLLPVLSLAKSVSLPRRVGEGVYELDYRFKVSNTGAAPAPNVRVIDNLNCTFDMDRPDGLVAAWELRGPPKARHGILQVTPGFTGRAACDREAAASVDPFKLPLQAVLGITDGSRALAPGQSEELEFTVRVTRKPSSSGVRVPFTNKAWAAAFEQNTANPTPAMLVAASASSVSSMLADPQGTVYNAVSRQPVAGAVVTIARQSCVDAAAKPMTLAELFGGDSGLYRANANGSLSMTTGADGGYQFYFLSPPVTGICTYALSVASPAGSAYASPSQLIPATPGAYGRCGAVVPNAASPQGAEPTTHHFSLKAGFDASGAACDVVNNHIPLDPGNVLGLVLRKEGSKRQVEFGDFLDYALVVTNKTGFPVTGLSLADQLPPGFAYVAGSARLNGAATADPVGGAGPGLTFKQPGLALGIDQSASVRYRVRVGVGAPTNGDAINRARASSGPMQSNLAQWTVRVTGGVFSDDAFLFGKVYMDCRRDGRQEGSDEVGVPGVRLYMEDGTHVITDVEGKWSLYGLKPVTHVLRVDPITLPAGAKLEALDNRNAGRPDSRFVDLKKGEFHKANFAIANCDTPSVMNDVIARREAIAAVPDTEAEAQVRMRLDPEGKVVPVGDRRSLPASGEVRGGGSTGTIQTSSAPLIAMPAASASLSSFVGGASGQGSTLSATTGGGATDSAAPVGSLFSGMRVSRGIAQPTAAAPLLPQAVPSPIDLEALLPRIESNALGFIDLKDGDTVPSTSLNVRVKGEAGMALRLSVNGQAVEARRVGKKTEQATGLKHVYDDGEVRATTYASRTAQTQQIEEFRAVGTSGPYYLSAKGGEFVDNSEQVEIVVRDRNQPDLVLQRTAVTRFVDYTVEPLTRRLLFTRAIASVDPNLNPQSIRVTYEVDAGGPKFTVAGTDVQLKVAKNLQVGVVAAIDENPENRRKLGALTALARLGDNTTVAGEWVQTDSDRNGKGSGARVELRHQGEDLAVAALASKTSTGFDNPGASFSAGRTEASARAEYRLDTTTALRSELLYGQDALREGSRRGITASVQKKFSEQLVGEVGLRYGHNGTGLGSGSGFDYGQISTYSGNLGSGVAANNVTALGAAANAGTQANANDDELTTVRARLSAQVPGVPQAQVFVEGEQDTRKSDRHVLAVGGNYAVTDKTRLYGRYELVSSLYGPYELNAGQSNNVGIVGIESAYMEGGRVYSEYRLADSLEGRAAQAATGLRNTFKLTDEWRLTGGIEHTRQIGGLRNSGNNGTGYASGLGGDSTALTGGVEYTSGRIKASGILEGRHGDDANTRLFSAGYGFKIDPSWSLLARSVMSASEGQGANAGNAHHLARHQIGLAYRPVDTDSWNALMRYERRSERVTGTGSATGALDGASVFGTGHGNASLPGATSADIVSAHLNYNPRPGTVINGRYAAKWSRADDGLLKSTYWAHLLQARYTQDLNDDWDLGVQAGLLRGKGGGLQKTLGVELGYQVMKDLWVSAGYNFVGLKDRDLAANDYTSKGAYIRLRFKFDETTLGAASAGAAARPMGSKARGQSEAAAPAGAATAITDTAANDDEKN